MEWDSNLLLFEVQTNTKLLRQTDLIVNQLYDNLPLWHYFGKMVERSLTMRLWAPIPLQSLKFQRLHLFRVTNLLT